MPHTVALVLTGYPPGPLRRPRRDRARRAGGQPRGRVARAHLGGRAGRRRDCRAAASSGAGGDVRQRSARPFEDVPSADLLLVLPVFTIVEPAALRLVCRRLAESGEAALAVDCGPDAERRLARSNKILDTSEVVRGCVLSTGIVAMSGDSLERVRGAACVPEALRRLAVAGRLGTTTVAPYYCARLFDQRDVAARRARLPAAHQRRRRRGVLHQEHPCLLDSGEPRSCCACRSRRTTSPSWALP